MHEAHTYKNQFTKIVLAFLDLTILNAALFIAIVLIDWICPSIIIPEFSDRKFNFKIFTHILLSVICVSWFWVNLYHYSYRKSFFLELKEVFSTIFIFAIIKLSLMALSRLVWLLSWGLTLILIPIFRLLVKCFLNNYGFWKKQTFIIGSSKNALVAYSALQSEEVMGLSIITFYNVDGSCPQSIISGVPILRDEKELSLRSVTFNSSDVSYIISHKVIILKVKNNLDKWTSRFLKRSFDILGAMLIIVILLPALLVLALIVGCDGGSPIYSHERVGLNGRKFNCLKFRSMVLNSKEVLEEVLRTDPASQMEWNKDFKLKKDPRITKMGHFIRKTSLDELPQLWNVMCGDMSLVGPRPIIEEELKRYAADVDYYLMAKPGMTGLWQVSGRNDLDYETRIYFDSWYVKNWSLWHDIAILFKTVGVVLKRHGAY